MKERGSLEGLCGKDHEWDHNEGEAVEGTTVCVCREDILQALNEKGKAPEPSEVSLELITACGGVGIQVMAEICQSPRWIWNAS